MHEMILDVIDVVLDIEFLFFGFGLVEVKLHFFGVEVELAAEVVAEHELEDREDKGFNLDLALPQQFHLIVKLVNLGFELISLVCPVLPTIVKLLLAHDLLTDMHLLDLYLVVRLDVHIQLLKTNEEQVHVGE
jgi:hypothetical protein